MALLITSMNFFEDYKNTRVQTITNIYFAGEENTGRGSIKIKGKGKARKRSILRLSPARNFWEEAHFESLVWRSHEPPGAPMMWSAQIPTSTIAAIVIKAMKAFAISRRRGRRGSRGERPKQKEENWFRFSLWNKTFEEGNGEVNFFKCDWCSYSRWIKTFEFKSGGGLK